MIVAFASRRPSISSKDFSSETTEPILMNFHIQPPGNRKKESYIFGSGHMIKMAAMPIYKKRT